MPETTERPVGKSMRELHALIAADSARWDTLHDEWLGLTEDEQLRVIAFAKSLASEDAP